MTPEKNFPSSNSNTQGEIDLIEIIIYIQNVLKRNFNTIIIFFFIGLIAGLMYYFLAKKTYTSSMVISSGMLTAANGSSLINTLDVLVQEENFILLSKKLGMTPNQVESIKEINVSSIFKEEEEDNDMNIFRINVQIHNNDLLDSLESGIIHYLEGNVYVKKRIELKKKNLLTLIDKINEEISEIDSIKNNVHANMVAKSDNLNLYLLDPVSIYKEAITLFQQELELQSELELIDNIQVIESFTRFERSISPRTRHIIFGPLLGLLFSFIVISIKEANLFLKKRETAMKEVA